MQYDSWNCSELYIEREVLSWNLSKSGWWCCDWISCCITFFSYFTIWKLKINVCMLSALWLDSLYVLVGNFLLVGHSWELNPCGIGFIKGMIRFSFVFDGSVCCLLCSVELLWLEGFRVLFLCVGVGVCVCVHIQCWEGFWVVYCVVRLCTGENELCGSFNST